MSMCRGKDSRKKLRKINASACVGGITIETGKEEHKWKVEKLEDNAEIFTIHSPSHCQTEGRIQFSSVPISGHRAQTILSIDT